VEGLDGVIVELAKDLETEGAKGDVAPAPVLPKADADDGAEAKADWGVVEDPPTALAPKADCGIVDDPLIARDAELKALCEGTAGPKALCADAAGAKALCTCAGAPNALCVGPAVGAPNDGCPNADPCDGADANPGV
jgi:hypothetical protein